MFPPLHLRLFCVPSRKPAELKDLAPGTNPPFLLYNGVLKTDFIKIEEFLEQMLAPPRLLFCSLDNNVTVRRWWLFQTSSLLLSSLFSPPCRYPHLSPINKESFDVGADIFAKFSAFIKNSPNNACKFGMFFVICFFKAYPHGGEIKIHFSLSLLLEG